MYIIMLNTNDCLLCVKHTCHAQWPNVTLHSSTIQVMTILCSEVM